MNLSNNIWQFIKQYRITITLSILISIIFFTIGAVPEKFYFNKEAITSGETWRFLTAHLVHSDLEHLTWNLCALIILSLLIESENRQLLLTSLLAGVISIDYYLWFNPIGIVNYAGFSGVLNTLLVIALFQQLQKKSEQLFFRLLPIVIYIASFLKIIAEIFSQQAIFSTISWQAVPQVHLIGFMSGTVLGVLVIFSAWVKDTKLPNPLHNNG